MAPSLGVNLRVTGHCNQGGRKYMEDIFSVAYQQTDDEKDLEYAFFGIFDGHGGREAAQFAKDNLMELITKNTKFWSDDDDTVLKAIREGFLETQKQMWSDLPKWRKTPSGLPSTAGTTASICFIKRGKLFVGHVGDSGIILGQRDPLNEHNWVAKRLTTDHKPESDAELSRIQEAGGKVVSKSGVPRVVWYRPSGAHQGPVRRSTHIDEVPFLAVARALGDLWSYNAKDDIYVVSPDPDLHVYDLSTLKDRCLILATDGVWNVVNPTMAVTSILGAERNNEEHMLDPQGGHTWINPSKKLVDLAIDRWTSCNLRADNTSVVTVMLDPPGPPRAQVLRKKREANQAIKEEALEAHAAKEAKEQEKKGISIISRYPNSVIQEQKTGQNLIKESPKGQTQPPRIVHDSTNSAPVTVHPEKPQPLQCNEISSSDDETTPPPVPKRPLGGHNNKATAAKSLNRELAALQQEDGPAKRTRRQSGPATKRQAPPPLPHRRSIIQQEDSDAENNLPSHRQPNKRPKTPEEPQTRVLRPRNTPQTPQLSQETRKRQRSFESAAIAKKTPKTALKAASSNTNNAANSTLNNSRVKLSLRSRMN